MGKILRTLSVVGKYIDQPLLIGKLKKAMPAVLAVGSAAFVANKTIKAKKEDKKKVFVKTATTLGVTVASALAAPKIVNKIFKVQDEPLKVIKNNVSELIDNFVSKTAVDEKALKTLNKAKEKILNPNELKDLYESLGKSRSGRKFLSEFIENPENITSSKIFSEISRLSILGAIPVVGGITGGILADKLAKDEKPKSVENKIKEGAYQYLANIFMCNVGAALALKAMEMFKVNSKGARALAMVAGITLTGVIGGSHIANLIGEKIIEPCFRKNNKEQNDNNKKDVFEKRTPELIDIGLHVDDLATVAVMSGLKWIEPALPIMYTISGFKAGMGYRNHHHHGHHHLHVGAHHHHHIK